MFALMDVLRKTQGDALEVLGFGPTECGYQVVASGPRWRLRDYGGPDAAPLLLIVAAPIKRPYLWDLAPSVSAVRYCLRQRLHVYLLEWTAPSRSNGNAGLAEYADQAIGEAVATVSPETGGMQPFLIGSHRRCIGSATCQWSCSPERAALLPARREPLPGCPRCDGSIGPVGHGYRTGLAPVTAQRLSLSADVRMVEVAGRSPEHR